MILWTLGNLIFTLAVIFWLYSLYKSQKSLTALEDQYIASMKRSLALCEEHTRLTKDRIYELKAQMLYEEFMKKAKEKDE